jgi:hypothetical protein
MDNDTPTTELASLVSEAAVLHLQLETARAQRDAADAAISAAIGPYGVLTNRISSLTSEMIRSAAEGLQGAK